MSTTASGAVADNLPYTLTSFIGRQHEIAEIVSLMGGKRLLTLTGSGGTGKTRLALEAAAGMRAAFADGIWLVELASLADPAFVPQTTATVLYVSEQPGQPVMQALTGYLRDRELLLLLDNCEHLLPACRQMAQALLQACPDLKILATSREALGIAGESTYRVPSLALPAAEIPPNTNTLERFDSIRLFVERARAAQAHFTLNEHNAAAVAQVCRRLDGIPLAIELAAARVRMLTATQIAARLDDTFQLLTQGSQTAPLRHQTLRAAMDWSQDLLLPVEQMLFWRLSVFAGGFTLEAVEAVCAGYDIAARHVFDLLSALVDKSLVVVDERDESGGARYRLLEPVRQYAHEHLTSAGEAERLRSRHLGFFCEVTAVAEMKIRGPEQLSWFDRLAIEHENLRAAGEWALAGGDVVDGLRLGGTLFYFCWIRGYWLEWRERLRSLLARPEAAECNLVRLKALFVAGVLSILTENLEHARIFMEEGIEIGRALGPEAGPLLAMTIGYWAWGIRLRDLSGSLALMRDAKPIADAGSDPWVKAHIALGMGLIYWREGEYAIARTSFVDSIERARDLGDRFLAAAGMDNLGQLAYREGNYVEALKLLKECVSVFREYDVKFNLMTALRGLGDVALAQGDLQSATQAFGEVLHLAREFGHKEIMGEILFRLGHVARRERDLAAALDLCRESLEALRTVNYPLSLGEVCASLALLAMDKQAYPMAVEFFAASRSIRGESDAYVAVADRQARVQALNQLKAKLGKVAFDAAWEAGQSMSLDDIASEAERLDAFTPANEQTAPPKARESTYPADLTAREVEILRWLARGLSNSDIADRLVISPRTVSAHLRSIFGKLDVTTRTAAARAALDLGIL